MKKVFRLENLDCAHCAAKMERSIGKIEGVKSAGIDFFGARLTLEAEEADMERVTELAAKACRKIEPDCRICL